MTLAVRLIPCLDIDKGRVVKGLRFENIRDAGDPVESASRYEREGADELTFLDITASHEDRDTLVHLVEHVADVLSIPFTVGGGVRSAADAGRLLAAGADRVAVNTAALASPSLITEIAEKYGSQCVVVAVDSKRVDEGGVLTARAMTHGGRRVSPWKMLDWVRELTARGAGEILLTSVDADGTQNGFDLEMIRAVREGTNLPIIASGGAGKLGHFAQAVTAGADAVLAASVFHDRIFSIRQVKEAMARDGVVVRPPERSPFDEIQFDSRGLVPVAVRDGKNGRLLTLAWANREALERTLETGETHFFSRSRQALWKKGETSGNTQDVVTISVDCDRDAVSYTVIPKGPACHTGAQSCFSEAARLRPDPASKGIDLEQLFNVVEERKAHPESGSYTNKLLNAGIARIAKKTGEEGVEVALAAVCGSDEDLAGEIADLLYHVTVLMSARNLAPGLVEERLRERRGKRREK